LTRLLAVDRNFRYQGINAVKKRTENVVMRFFVRVCSRK